MSRTVSSNHAGESFEGLLDRLTRRASSADSPANFEFVSASEAVAAPSQGTRRRALASVTEVKPRGSKPESMPLSYETALRIHARRSLVPDTDLRNPDLRNPDLRNPDLRNLGEEGARPDGTGVARAGHEQAERAKSTPPNQRPVSRPASGALSASAERANQLANQVRDQIARKGQEARPAGKPKRAPDASGMAAGRGAAQASIATPASNRASAMTRSKIEASAPGELLDGSRTMARRKSPAQALPTRNPASRSSAARSPSKAAQRTKHSGEAKTPAPAMQSTRQPARRGRMQSEELGLEIQRSNLQLEHRNAVVSIRLNDLEIDRLRQRAAESGISVSAYMRSCVLDAEHLRAQVKQALAEMRASIQPTPPASHLAVLSSTGSGIDSDGGSGWSRLFWRSATFLLGPWFLFRHRG